MNILLNTLTHFFELREHLFKLVNLLLESMNFFWPLEHFMNIAFKLFLVCEQFYKPCEQLKKYLNKLNTPSTLERLSQLFLDTHISRRILVCRYM
jgi:hypothetical protein